MDEGLEPDGLLEENNALHRARGAKGLDKEGRRVGGRGASGTSAALERTECTRAGSITCLREWKVTRRTRFGAPSRRALSGAFRCLWRESCTCTTLPLQKEAGQGSMSVAVGQEAARSRD